MLTEREVEQATAQLVTFQQANTQHQQTLSEILEKHATLIEDYKRLKSDYEEERDARERYKQLVRGQDRNPFVLVLVDGDGYIFDDSTVGNGAEGGQTAARLLNDAVMRSLRDRGLDHCRIMVRIYADLVGLSRTLSRHKIVGAEKRSLAPFVANFNRSNGLFDFVDAGELKENADSKLRAIFRQFVDSTQCKHIYFAGCHDTGYINDLTSYASERERITLVRGSAFHPEFNKLGLRIEDFHGVFRSTPLESTTAYRPPTYTPSAAATPASMKPTVASSTSDPDQKVCHFYQKGICKYGSSCHNLHVKLQPNGHPPSMSTATLNDVRTWRRNTSTSDTTSLPFRMPSLMKTDNDFMNNHNIAGSSNAGNQRVQTQTDFATLLPQADSIPPGHIPVNKDQQRLDAYSAPASPADRAAFNARIALQKLCNNFNLNGYCGNEFANTTTTQSRRKCLIASGKWRGTTLARSEEGVCC